MVYCFKMYMALYEFEELQQIYFMHMANASTQISTFIWSADNGFLRNPSDVLD